MSYSKFAMKIFGGVANNISPYFSELKEDLKKSDMGITLLEYLSTTLLTCTIVFIFELPLLSFIFSLLKLGPLFSLFFATTISIVFCILLFLFFLNYPKFIIKDKVKSIEKNLPFATIYLSTISSSGVPPNKIFELFSKLEDHGEISKEAKKIVLDMKAFGLNIYEALSRSIERVPSIELRDLFWSITSILRSGGDLAIFLRERSTSYLNNYRRKLNEFSRNLAIYLEIYLTILVLGAIFFTILTSIMMGLGGNISNVVFIQFFVVFIFIPLTSAGFIILIKASSPGGE
ncbi:MAG: type II secretion system F family protein [Candidatus Aenigmarchaeota archaeon]|nr:type II secretion system F family protein [Candidatus Aenigmarchaeota archaeon]